MGKKDTTTDLTEASKIASKNDYFKDSIIMIDEFEGFSNDQHMVIESMIANCKDIYIALRSNNLYDTENQVFSTVNDTFSRIKDVGRKYGIDIKIQKFDNKYRFKNKELGELGNVVYQNYHTENKESENIRVFSAENIYSETEYVAATIKRLVNENDIKYNDIAVLSNNLSAYSLHLESSFKRYEIPYNLSLNKGLSYTPLMQYITGLLDILCRKNPDTESILRYAKTGLTDLKDDEISELENYIYIWNTDNEKWFEEFTAGDEFTDVEKIESIRQKLIFPLVNLSKEISSDEKVINYATKLIEFITDNHVDKKLSKMFEDDENINSEMEFVWNKFIEILDSVVETFGETKMEFKEFSNLFLITASQISFDMPPMMLDSVEIADAKNARLSDAKAVFIIGAIDGSFPMISEENTIFTDAEKKVLKEAELDMFKSVKQLDSEGKLASYKALMSASEKIYITYSLTDNEGKKSYPCDAVGRIKKEYTKSYIKDTNLDISYFALTKEAVYYQYVLQGAGKNKNKFRLKKYLENDSKYIEKIEFLENIRNISDYEVHNKALLRKNIGEDMCISPSNLEDYKKCPFIYFCKKILKLYKPKTKEINPLEKGNVIHFILENIMKEYSKEDFVHMSDKELERVIKEYSSQYYKKQLGNGVSINSRMNTIYSRTSANTKVVIQHIQNELMQSDFCPDRFELEIGPEKEAKGETIELENGCKLTIIGKTDRVDVLNTGNDEKAVRIIDYKSGKKSFSFEKIYNGFDHQMLLYLFILTDDDNLYSGYTPAGVLYMPSGNMKNSVAREEFLNDTQDIINENYKMNGFVLNEVSVIRSMEKDIKGIYIPAVLDSTGEKFTNESNVISEEQMEKLKKFIFDDIKETAEQIYKGKFECLPHMSDEYYPCDYCDYADICLERENKDSITKSSEKISASRATTEQKIDGFFEKISEKEDKNSNGMD
jgi:ATP-dependent helicase/nuclease subunit B